MKADDRFYKIQQELFCDGGCVETENKPTLNLPIFDFSNVNDFIDKLNSVNAPYVRATYTNLESKHNVVVYLTISLDQKSSWSKGILENSRYGKFRIERNGTIEKVSGSLPKFKKSYAKTQDDVIAKLNKYISSPEKYDDGGNLEIQTAYYPASDVCESLNTLVPSAMASELKIFNIKLKNQIQLKYNLSIAEYVAMKLHYNSVDDLCYDPIKKDEGGNRIVRFAKEQIDAIATAIYSHEEKGDAIIIADQTGVGKGRTAAGLIRYAILDKKVVPFFFTEKKHLINDIYRDLVDIGFDAGIIEQEKTEDVIRKEDWSEEEILSIIIKDIEDKDDVSVEYDFPEGFNPSWIKEFEKMGNTTEKQMKGSEKVFDYEKISEIIDELIALYNTMLIEQGQRIIVFKDVSAQKIKDQEREAEKQGKIRVRPFFPNDEEIVDKDGNVLYKRIGPTKLKEIFGYQKDSKGKWYYDYNIDTDDLLLPKEFMLFTIPFSQARNFEDVVRGNVMVNPKFRFYQKYANNSVIIIDEAHAASGSNPDNPSNTFRAISDIIERSSMTTYLSATYAKRETNMPLYAKATSLRESGLSDREMIDTFNNGGNALKEAVSAELTRNGQLLRREKMIQGKSDYYYGDPDSNDLNVKNISLQQVVRLNVVAGLFVKIREFQVQVHEIIGQYRDTLPEINPLQPNSIRGTKQEVEKQRTIKALTFQMFNFFLLGLKIDQTTQFAIEKLKSGIKPVITIANTLESALRNMPKTYKTDNEDDRYKEGEIINNDFNLYLAYLLFYTMHWKKRELIVEDDGTETIKAKVVCVYDDNHELSRLILQILGTTYESLLNEILSTVTGVSIAPIDMIKTKIQKEGFSIDEITGRQLKVEFENNDYTKGKITKRIRKDTTSLVRDFNENKVDCLFINQSGAVGISMHARPVGQANIVYPIVKEEVEIEGQIQTIEAGWPTSLENKKEVKKRAMIVTQMELDINKEVQKLGRINRTGQVYPPEFTYIISAIPSENRLTALMEKKLRSLSANVSSNQQQSAYLFESEDFFSITAIPPFNETLNTLRRQYPILSRIRNAREGIEAGVEDIRDFTKMLYFMDYNLQKDFYETFTTNLNNHITNLIRDGLFTGKITKKDYKAETVSKHPFYIGNENAQTSFGRHSFIEKAFVMEYKSKNSDRDVLLDINNRFQHTRHNPGTSDEEQKLIRFKKSASDELKSNIKKNSEAIQEEVKRLSQLIQTKTDLLKEKNKELSKYGQVSQIVELEGKLFEVNDKLKNLRQELSDAMINNPQKIADLGNQMTTLNDEQKDLKSKIEAFGDVSQIKQEFKSLERDIKTLDKDVAELKNDIVRTEKEGNDYSKLMKSIEEKINMIGKVFVIKRYEEKYITTNDLGEPTNEVQKYEYSLVSSEICVLTGVFFPEYNQKIIPSSVNVYFMSITDNYSEPLSKLSPKISQIDSDKGKKSVIELVAENVYYNDEYITKDKIKTTYWNNLVKETDTGTQVVKWFVVGSPLKSFMLSKRNGYNGEILKFTMKNNIDRIGIEITNKVDANDPSISTYSDLDRRYDEDTALEYLIFFDGNSKNMEYLMTDYIYHHLLGRLYDLNDTKDFDNFDYDVNYNTKYLFFISSVYNPVVIITPGKYLIEECLNTYQQIKDGNFDVNDKIDKNDIIQQLSVKLIAEATTRFTDIFALMLQRTGVTIDDNNYKIYGRNQSISFPTITSSGEFPRIAAKPDDIFKTIFPIDLTFVRQILANNSALRDFSSMLEMTYNEFLSALVEFERENQKPTFAIGSSYFKKQNHLYILEQFVDNITDVAQDSSGQIDFVPVKEDDIDKQISSMIDNLVKIISNE